MFFYDSDKHRYSSANALKITLYPFVAFFFAAVRIQTNPLLGPSTGGGRGRHAPPSFERRRPPPVSRIVSGSSLSNYFSLQFWAPDLRADSVRGFGRQVTVSPPRP